MNVYEIRVKGHIPTNWFDELTVCYGQDSETVLIGTIVDQAALHGILIKIRDLGLTLIAINRIERSENT